MQMKLVFVLALISVISVAYAQQQVARCSGSIRDNDCMRCTSSFVMGTTVGAVEQCGFCPASASEGTRCINSRTATCDGILTAATADQCPAPSGGGGSSTTTCLPVADRQCDMATIPVCTEGRLPFPTDPPNCCPSCKPACPNGFSADSSAPVCMAGMLPMRNTTTCKLSCRPLPQCNDLATVITTLPDCSSTNPPGINPTTGCPTCKPPRDQDCSSADCSGIATCAAGSFPSTPDATNLCCPNCRPRPPCDPTVCESSFKDLRECASGESPVFSEDTCCPSCRIVDTAANRPPSSGECTRDQVKACIANRPFCKPGEERVFDPTQACCASCKRPLRDCSLADVAACAGNIRDCGASESPVVVEGSCCPSCKPAAPTCSPACSATQICAARPDLNGAAQADACLDVEERTFTFTGDTDAKRDILKQFDGPKARRALLELVERVCSVAEFSEPCKKYRKMIVRSALCERTSAAGAETVVITCKFPKPATTTRSVDSPAELADEAAEEEAADSEFAVQSDGSGSGSGSSAASALSPSVLVVLALAAISLFFL